MGWSIQRNAHVRDEREELDPSRFGDPVAERTKWRLLGTNYDQLVRAGPRRIETRMSRGRFVVLGILLLLPVVLPPITGLFWGLLFGLPFAAAGAWVLYAYSAPATIDLNRRLYWRGRKQPHRVPPSGSNRAAETSPDSKVPEAPSAQERERVEREINDATGTTLDLN